MPAMKLRTFRQSQSHALAIIQAVHHDNPESTLYRDSADHWVVEHPTRLIISKAFIQAAVAQAFPSLQDDDWKVIRTAFDRAPRETPSGWELIGS